MKTLHPGEFIEIQNWEKKCIGGGYILLLILLTTNISLLSLAKLSWWIYIRRPWLGHFMNSDAENNPFKLIIQMTLRDQEGIFFKYRAPKGPRCEVAPLVLPGALTALTVSPPRRNAAGFGEKMILSAALAGCGLPPWVRWNSHRKTSKNDTQKRILIWDWDMITNMRVQLIEDIEAIYFTTHHHTTQRQAGRQR